jgi:Uma2 family endonuclease
MSSADIHTAAEYGDRKLDLPEGGRWTELVAGEIVTLQPPDDLHGNVVRNVMLAFSKFAHQSQRGYACFEIGIVTHRQPDTVRCPPACYFLEGAPFAEIDNLIAQTKPAVVVEIASTNDRRSQMEQCVTEYLDLGIPLVWVIDPDQKQVHVFQPNRTAKRYSEHQILYGSSVLDDFQFPVGDLFALPPWWNDKGENGRKSP